MGLMASHYIRFKSFWRETHFVNKRIQIQPFRGGFCKQIEVANSPTGQWPIAPTYKSKEFSEKNWRKEVLMTNAGC